MSKYCKYPPCGKPLPEGSKADFCGNAHRVANHRLQQKKEHTMPTKPPSKPSSRPRIDDEDTSEQVRDLTQERPWIGPRIWLEMPLRDLHAKLTAAGAYRDWARAEGLNHMMMTRGEVANLIRQAGHDPEENLIALVIHDVPVQSTESKSKAAPPRAKPAPTPPPADDEDDDMPKV